MVHTGSMNAFEQLTKAQKIRAQNERKRKVKAKQGSEINFWSSKEQRTRDAYRALRRTVDFTNFSLQQEK